MKISWCVILVLIFCTSCSNSNNTEFQVSSDPPAGIRGSYYEKSIKVLNSIYYHFNNEKEYINEEKTEVLQFFMKEITESDIELNVKSSLSLLDLFTETYIEAIQSKDNNTMAEYKDEFKKELEKTKQLLNLN